MRKGIEKYDDLLDNFRNLFYAEVMSFFIILHDRKRQALFFQGITSQSWCLCQVDLNFDTLDRHWRASPDDVAFWRWKMKRRLIRSTRSAMVQ